MTETTMPAEVFQGLDRHGPMPLYFQIAECIEKVIVEGLIPVESWIENEITLAARLRTSRTTTRRALEELVHRGLLQRRQGRGTQVVSGTVVRPVALSSLHDDLRRSGRTPTTRVLRNELVPAPEPVSVTLRLSAGRPTVHLRRVRYSESVPVAVLDNWLPAPISDLSDSDLEEHGLYELLRFRGVSFRTAHQRIGARRAEGDEAALLGLPTGSMVLTMSRVVSDPQGRVVDVGDHCYRPEGHAFEMTLSSI